LGAILSAKACIECGGGGVWRGAVSPPGPDDQARAEAARAKKLDRLARARDKERVARQRSFWAAPDFSEKQREGLLNIFDALAPPLSNSAKGDIMFRTQWAVQNLAAARLLESGGRNGSAVDNEAQLGELLKAARSLAQAWGAIRTNKSLRGSVDDRLKGVLPLGLDHLASNEGATAASAPDQCEVDPATLAHEEELAILEQARAAGLPEKARHELALAEQMQRRERADRLQKVLRDDLRWMIGEIRQMHTALKNARAIRNSAEYACVRLVASAWLENTGALPTATRNVGAVSGKQATPFQRFLAIAVPPPAIGEETVRTVVDAMRQMGPPLGVKKPRNFAKKNPKGMNIG
jgi:hypothetical protein